jgi:hypothetical protein
MNRDIADKWAAALRSGQYSQTEGCLKRRWEDGSCSYCALGVLCDLFKQEHPDEVLEDQNGDGSVVYIVDDSVHLQELPERVAKWAGTWDQTVRFNRTAHPVDYQSRKSSAYGLVYTVSDANDFGLFFDEVADLIDRHRDTM